MSRLRTSDLEAVLDFLGEASSVEGPDPFPQTLLESLHRLVGAEPELPARWLGLGVLRESGGRISFGQSIVRQLPAFFQVFWVDAMFALFTERHQRAFELLSKTRVVLKPEVA